MRKLILLFTTSLVFFIFGCNTETVENKPAKPDIQVTETSTTQAGTFKVEFKTNPVTVSAGTPADLVFTVKNEKGDTIKDLQIVHEKPIHLLVVSEDLSQFYHLHPEAQTDGSYKVSFEFPNGGNYRLYTDFTPLDSQQIVQNFPVEVSGDAAAKIKLKVDSKLEKTVENLRIIMKPDSELSANKELMLNFQVFDSNTGKPVTNLENYLGAKAHFVVISQNLQEFVHAHPISTDNVKGAEHSSEMSGMQMTEEKPHSHSEKLNGVESQSIVSAHVIFSKPGLYKIFAQFQRAGNVITAPFTVAVAEGKEEKALDLSKVSFPKGAIKIIVTKDGFVPNEISYKQGEPLNLAFYRADSNNCGSEIIFKDLHITKKLPVGEVVLVNIPTETSGEFSFACGMNMMKGKVIVQ